MLILINGVAGFIGEAAMHGFLHAGHSVIGVYRKTVPNYFHPNLLLLHHSLLSTYKSRAKIDIILDCSADIPSKQSNQNILFLNNTQSLTLLLDFASHNKINNIIYMSSMAAFGAITARVVKVHTEDGDRSPYGLSKFYCEKLIQDWTILDNKRNSVILRLPGIVGNKSHDNFISDVYQKIKNSDHFILYNKNALFNNVVHVETLVNFLIELVKTGYKGCFKLLIGSKSPETIGDIIKKMQLIQMKHPIIEWRENEKSFIIDFESSEKLGYTPLATMHTINKFTTDRLLSEI